MNNSENSAMVIVVKSEKGGTGKTTIATTLASMFVLNGQSILIIDADNSRSRVSKGSRLWIEKRNADSNLAPIQLIPAPSKDLVLSTIKRERKNYDIIIVDTQGGDTSEARMAMLLSDLILIPLQPSELDYAPIASDVEVIEEVFSTSEKAPSIAFVQTRIANNSNDSRSKQFAEAINNRFPNIPILETKIHGLTAFADAFSFGCGVAELHKPYSSPKASADAYALLKEVISILYPNLIGA